MAGVLLLFVITFIFKITTAQIFRPINDPQIQQYGVIPNPHHTHYLPMPTEKQEKNAFCSKSENNLDNEVLNNVALALQFLLVKNILNSPTKRLRADEADLSNAVLGSAYPLPGKAKLYDTLARMPTPIQSHYDQYYNQISNPVLSNGYIGFPPCLTAASILESQKSMPNANFIGTSNFVDNSVLIPGLGLASAPKRSYNIMSPYEVLGSSPELGSKVNYDAAFAPYITEPKDYAFGIF